MVKEESPWLRNLTGQANPQQDSDNKEATEFVHNINILAQLKWVFKWGLKRQNWLKLENKLRGHNQGESSAQMRSNLPLHSAPFSPEIFSPNSLHYNLGDTKKANWAIILWSHKLIKHYQLQQSIYLCLMLFHFTELFLVLVSWEEGKNINTQRASAITCPLRICSLDLLSTTYLSKFFLNGNQAMPSLFSPPFSGLFWLGKQGSVLFNSSRAGCISMGTGEERHKHLR